MATLEQVEKLREKANVSYDEARAALESSGGDLLEALILLERQGKVPAPAGGGYYNSEKAPQQEAPADGTNKTGPGSGETFVGLLKRFGRFLVKLVQKGNLNTFEVYKGDVKQTAFPITAMVLLTVFLFWVTIPLMIIGLFFNFRYRFAGPDLGKESVNNAMDSAANAAEDLKKSITEEHK